MKNLTVEAQTIKNLIEELLNGYPIAEGGYYNEYNRILNESNAPIDWIGKNIDKYKDYNMFLYSNGLLTLYSVYRAIYAIFILEDKEKALEEFSRANEYGYLTLHITSMLCYIDCDIYGDDEYVMESKPQIEMDEISTLWGISFLMNDFEKADNMAKDLIDSLNTKGCIIARGNRTAYVEWFMVKLYALVMNIELDKRKPMYPKKDSNFKFYEEILDDWDTEDIVKVQLMIDTLCTLRLDLTEPMLNEDDDFRKPFLRLLPFEVIMFLRLREREGIKNPTKFTHSLMNTPLMTILVETSEIKSKPVASLPYAKKLLENLDDTYSELILPNEVYPILEKEIKKEEPIPQIHLKSREPAPKAGRYQPNLPKGHPDEEFVKEPRFIKRIAEGKSIGTFGLTDGNEELIVWVYLGE